MQGAFGELWLLQPVKGPSLTKRCSPCLVLVLVLVLVLEKSHRFSPPACSMTRTSTISLSTSTIWGERTRAGATGIARCFRRTLAPATREGSFPHEKVFPVPRSRSRARARARTSCSFPCLFLVLVLVLVPRASCSFPVPRSSFPVPRASCPASKFDSSPCVSRGEYGMRGVPNRSDFRFDPASGAPALRFVPVVAGRLRPGCSGPFVVQKPLPRLREKPAPGRLGQVFRTAGFMFFRIVQTPD